MGEIKSSSGILRDKPPDPHDVKVAMLPPPRFAILSRATIPTTVVKSDFVDGPIAMNVDGDNSGVQKHDLVFTVGKQNEIETVGKISYADAVKGIVKIFLHCCCYLFQEMSKEIPAGSLPRSLDVILHHDIVEQPRAGDTVIFTGTVVVIPDILALAAPGERADCHRVGGQSQRSGSGAVQEGVKAMEQQTISITKAGIRAKLNARTSILAAANPTGGRYDKTKPLKYNVALPPAILSRFDLVYVMIDDPDDTTDYHIASHTVRLHQKKEEVVSPTFSTAQLKR
ncbi:hypothetical protein SSX86_030798 [Deinandra increscens subsp. villosa]|uniref:MCM C-terminal AAA(+) ATPase domain-containing protein n=1 Tax=Deinandra increscens subsp. villosa TaxID=3103831 RepID=A0AAP0GIW2_9ASTR